MKNYKYSILIPHKNEGFLIDIMLDSVYNKVKYENFEILIGDDGSDNRGNLKNLKNHFLKDKIKIFYSNSLGPAKVRNILGKNATGDILIFTDAHMYFQDDFLTKISNIFNEKKDIGILQTIVGPFDEKNANWEFYYFNGLNLNVGWMRLKDRSKKDLYEIPMIACGALIIKKEIFKKLDGFNNFLVGRGVEDMDLSMRAWLYGYKCFLTKETKFVHHFRTSFNNYEVKTENILYNKLIFIHTCFQEKKYINEFMKNLNKSYINIFDKVYKKVINNAEFWKYVENQRKNYKYSDNWYLEKFKCYYDGYLNINN